MVRTVFTRIENASEDIVFNVTVSMVEIYNERIKDLLDPAKDNLRIHEKPGKGVYLQDVTENYIESEDQVYQIMRHGNDNRAVASTNMNE